MTRKAPKSQKSIKIPSQLSENLNTITNYYRIDKNNYSYLLACDVIEKVLNDDYYNLDVPLTNPFRKGGIFNKHRIGNYIKRRVASSSLMYKIHKGSSFQNTKFRELLDNVFYVKEKFERNYVPDDEIAEIIHRIDSVMNSEGGITST